MTFFFYDVETSGIDARWQRIMQFAGQRTDENLKPIGKPVNVLVRLSEEILPEPQAVFITGITPQKTLAEGISEADFTKLLNEKVFTKDTIALGFNSIRFDDEFIRQTLFRNFYDPYEREWSEGRGRWDVLDAVRMMRALRPEGIKWSKNSEDKPTNRLEALAKANKIEHSAAHDALADVNATIELTQLIKKAQPKLFQHLFNLRQKKEVVKLLNVEDPKPLVHSSGRLSSDHLSTSVVYPLSLHPNNPNAVLVYDLRISPAKFSEFDAKTLQKLAFTPIQELLKEDLPRLPVKAVHVNKSPALAPLGVLDDESQKRIGLTLSQIHAHLKELSAMKDFGQTVFAAWESQEPFETPEDVEGQLYDGFVGDNDKKLMTDLRAMEPAELSSWEPKFSDERLTKLVPRYLARNFPANISEDKRQLWEQYRAERLKDSSRGPSFTTYFNELQKLAAENQEDEEAMFLLEELQLYGESIAPFENEQLL